MQREFTFSDFISQMASISRLGSVPKFLTNRFRLLELNPREFEAQLLRIPAIYHAMTKWERDHVEQLDASRRRRIAAGAGVGILELSQLIRQFEMSRQMMRQIGSSRRRTPIAAVLGLVTNDPVNRDPSYVSPVPEREVWRRTQITIAIAISALLILAYAVFRHG